MSYETCKRIFDITAVVNDKLIVTRVNLLLFDYLIMMIMIMIMLMIIMTFFIVVPQGSFSPTNN